MEDWMGVGTLPMLTFDSTEFHEFHDFAYTFDIIVLHFRTLEVMLSNLS